MATEIERRWFVNIEKFKQLHDVTVLEKKEIVQFYLSTDPERTVRVRIVNDSQAFVTIKGLRSNNTCKEYEYEIPVSDANELMDLRIGHWVGKTRIIVPVENELKFEVDWFSDLNDGLVIAELELPSIDTVFEKPTWLGSELNAELCHRFSNSALALDPFYNRTHLNRMALYCNRPVVPT